MTKKIITFILTIILCFSVVACSVQPQNHEPTKPPVQIADDFVSNSEMGFTEFDGKMISFLEEAYGTEENFLVSPLSLKYALVLATIGAEAETQQQLLDVLGFKTVDECIEWAKGYRAVVDFTNDEGNGKDKTKLQIANSVWHNVDKKGKIKKDYTEMIKTFGANSYNVSGSKLKPEINEWVSKETNNFIKELIKSDISNANTVLLNTVYLKALWEIQFNEKLTHEDDFKTDAGKVIKKDFMQVQEHFTYYNDEETEFVVIPLKNDVFCLCVKGDSSNILTKLPNASINNIELHLPKVEIESTFDRREFITFINTEGATLPTDADNADFSNMIDTQIYIDDIIQKTKIKMDEDGLEASAATAIIMQDNAVPPLQEEPTVVKFDEHFRFYIYNFNVDGVTPELLFYGNYAN